MAIYKLKLAAYEIIKTKKSPKDSSVEYPDEEKYELTKEEKDQLALDLMQSSTPDVKVDSSLDLGYLPRTVTFGASN